MSRYHPSVRSGLFRTVAAFCAIGFIAAEESRPPRSDQEIIRILLEEKLETRSFAFATVMEAVSGKKVLPYQPESSSHQRVMRGIESSIENVIRDLNRQDSPIRLLRRINEASRYFEDGLMKEIQQIEGLSCEIPENAAGNRQRAGYPDLKITDQASGQVFYLDPKLVEQTSIESTLRTFYYEPRGKSGKILDDAVHLLIGIEHDGKDGAWQFTKWRIVDLSKLALKLKAEFQTSNSEMYRKEHSLLPSSGIEVQNPAHP